MLSNASSNNLSEQSSGSLSMIQEASQQEINTSIHSNENSLCASKTFRKSEPKISPKISPISDKTTTVAVR